mgnify:CR=1 FL=1
MSPLWQHVLIYALVLWCAFRLLRKYAPAMSWQQQAKISFFFERQHWSAFQRIGRALRPAAHIPAGCESHCSSCKRCA